MVFQKLPCQPAEVMRKLNRGDSNLTENSAKASLPPSFCDSFHAYLWCSQAHTISSICILNTLGSSFRFPESSTMNTVYNQAAISETSTGDINVAGTVHCVSSKTVLSTTFSLGKGLKTSVTTAPCTSA